MDENFKTFLNGLFEYILNVGKDIDETAIEEELLHISSDETMEVYMTLAEKIKERGKQEGKREGEIFDRQTILTRLLENKYGPIDEAQRRTIMQCRNREKLDRAIDLVLVADSAEEVLAVIFP